MIRTEFSAALKLAEASGIRETAGSRTSLTEAVIPAVKLAQALELLLAADDPDETALLYDTACRIRDVSSGAKMFLRGLIEFSSVCRNSCYYCGLNRTNTGLERYQLEKEEILDSVRLIMKAGIQTCVLQAGEDGRPAEWIADVVREIRRISGMAITLSVGERARDDYHLWKEAGADRFLLRVESTDPELYASLHKGRTLATRLRCLDDLRDLGYQVGSGIMIGVRGQTLAHIARDILFFRDRDFDMIGIGPFIPHPDTVLKDDPAGGVVLTLNAVALTRIVTRNAWLPATTALGSMDKDYRVEALKAGANIIMPNFTPSLFKKKYEIYPGKRCVSEHTGACAGCMQGLADRADMELDLSRGDSLKMEERRETAL